MKANEEWVIQSGVSLKYWKPGLGWRDEGARFQSYIAAATTLVNSDAAQCESARIVSAPPREMTDAECWAWLREQALSGYILAVSPSSYHNADPKDTWWCLEVDSPRRNNGNGATPSDAIRAARRKLEGK